MPKTARIWFACTYSGFYVIDLKPELRGTLGLPRLPTKGVRAAVKQKSKAGVANATN